MSEMIPRELIDSVKEMNDLSVQIYGQDCSLYIPQNWQAVETNDAYITTPQYNYTKYHTRVWIEYSPTKARLNSFGLFAEEGLPMLASFSNTLKDDSGFEYELEIPVNSYFTISIEYQPGVRKEDSFEIVNVLIPAGMIDRVSLKAYHIAPRRVVE